MSGTTTPGTKNFRIHIQSTKHIVILDVMAHLEAAIIRGRVPHIESASPGIQLQALWATLFAMG
jgi:hypothetical protein